MVDTAEECMRRGDAKMQEQAYSDAAKAYCQALDRNPRIPAAHYNIGAVLLLAKRPVDALPSLMTAMQLRPKNAQFAVAFARALLDSGERDRAAAYLANVRRRIPNNPAVEEAASQLPPNPAMASRLDGFHSKVTKKEVTALLKQAVNAFKTSNYERTMKLATQLMWSTPNSATCWKLMSGAARHVTNKEHAEMCARRALALALKDPEAWSNLSRIMRDANRIEDAQTLLEQAFEECGKLPALAPALVEILHERNRSSEALALIKAIEAEMPEPSPVMMRLHAETLDNTGDIDGAGEAYRAALAQFPKSSDLLAATAAFYDRGVDPEPLRLLIEKARADGVEFDRGDLLEAEARSLLREGNANGAQASIIKALNLPGEKVQIRSRHFTRGRVEDKLGNYREAYASFMRGNEALVGICDAAGTYDASLTVKRVERLNDKLQQEIASGVNLVEDPMAGPDNIAFIIGFPRSGTTLLDTIIRSHSKVEIVEEKGILNGAIQDCLPGFQGLEARSSEDWITAIHDLDPALLREKYLIHMARYAGEELSDNKLYIDKLPLNINWAPVLHRMFPRAVFILALRHPLDSAISNLFQDYKPNNAMLNMTSMEKIDRLYEKCFSMWEDFVAWRKPNFVEASYEDVVGDLEGTVTKIMNRLGLEWEDAQSRYFETALARGRINTPSYTQVSQKIYSSSKERWRNYEFAFQGADSANLRKWAIKRGFSLDPQD